jgi:hypothetical protein
VDKPLACNSRASEPFKLPFHDAYMQTTSKKMTMKTNAIPAQVNVGCVPLWTTQPKKKHYDPNKDWDTMSTSNWHWNDINYIILYTVIGTISRSQGNPLQREFHIYGFHSVSYSKRRHSTAGGISSHHIWCQDLGCSQSFTDPGAPPPFPNMVRHGIGHLKPNTGNHRNRISPLEFAMSKFLFNFVF